MHILLVGSGGREHSLAWKIAKSPLVKKLTCAGSNPGIAKLAPCIDLSTAEIPGFAQKEQVDLVVVGPEAPLADGLADELEAAGIACFGPSAAGAQLETSKAFMKELCDEGGIPTAAYRACTSPEEAKDFLRTLTPPFVIKADGLAAGKGVVIAQSLEEADQSVEDMMNGQFGDAGKKVVIEEFLQGTELSVFAVTDGETLLPFGAARDHKRAFDDDEGPNTGGMGGYAPSPLETPELMASIYETIITPTLHTLKSRGIHYRGVFYAGLMITPQGPKLIEYNCRFGDPECQILMRRLRSDIVPALWGAATGRLGGVGLDWMPDATANVVYATKGYPGAYEKGSEIRDIDRADAIEDVIVFHAGTNQDAGRILANGGRVLNITANGGTLGEALDKAYAAIAKIDWPDGYYRSDLGRDLR